MQKKNFKRLVGSTKGSGVSFPDFKKIAKISSELEQLNLFIDDNPILTNPTLRARARRL